MSADEYRMPNVGETRTLTYLTKKSYVAWGPRSYDNMIAENWVEVFEVSGKSYVRITDKGRAACKIGQEYHKGWIP